MGISLNGLTPAGTYPGLIKTGDNTAISGTPKVLSDGNGNNLPMEVSTTGVNFTNNLTQGGTALQPVLVSGTNIKTINGTSVLGSGNIPVVTSPSGVAGAIQFSNGSAFASDAANFFWDDTNNRLGVGTNAPSAIIQSQNATNGVLLARFKDAVAAASYIDIKNDATLNEYTGLFWGSTYRILAKDANPMFINCATAVNFADGYSTRMAVTSSEVQIGSITGARLGIKGSGSTSATTSLLVQNSAGTNIFKIGDSARIDVLGTIGQIDFSSYYQIFSTGNQSTVGCYKGSQAFSVDGSRLCVNVSTGSHSASASFQVDSTTTGILPPRMTTTQKNAIASPASGLILYDSTTNKLQCYNGSTWNDLF